MSVMKLKSLTQALSPNLATTLTVSLLLSLPVGAVFAKDSAQVADLKKLQSDALKIDITESVLTPEEASKNQDSEPFKDKVKNLEEEAKVKLEEVKTDVKKDLKKDAKAVKTDLKKAENATEKTLDKGKNEIKKEAKTVKKDLKNLETKLETKVENSTEKRATSVGLLSTAKSKNPTDVAVSLDDGKTTLVDNEDNFDDGEVVTSQPTKLPQKETKTNRQDDEVAIQSIEHKSGKTLTTVNLSDYAKKINQATWSPNMKVNSAMTVKLQALLDWNHASPGPLDSGWGMNSKKALSNFQAMKGLPQTGKMDQATWNALTQNIPKNQPVLVEYTLTKADVNTKFATTPASAEEKSKMKGLYYQNIKEMLGERFHMDVNYLQKLNPNAKYKVGETITVFNPGTPLNERITRVVADKANKTLYAYNGKKLVATYPTTVGSSATPSPHGTFKIINKVKMPWYKATVNDGENKQVFMLPPGPNSPVGIVWMGLNKPSYGIHGSPKPEGISRQASHGCIRLTNWDVLEVYANIDKGATVELK